MTTTLADRLAPVANTSTLRLTHYGRRSGTPYGVTIWFLVEGEAVCLATAVEVFVRTSAGSNAITRAPAWTPP